MKKAIVVGGGFGGIAAALRARAKGYAVNLFCNQPLLGGRAQVYRRNGYVFDAGPTVMTAPFLFEELFGLFDRRLEDYVQLVPVEPWYQFRFPEGNTFDYGGTLENLLDEIRRISPVDVDNYLRMLEHSKAIFEVGFEQLATQPFNRFRGMVKTVPDLVRLQSYKSVWKLVCQYIEHPLLRQAFSVQPLLVGGNPLDTTSIYCLIHYLERKWGVHYVLGGTGQLVEAFARLMSEEGIGVSLNSPVESIQIERGRACGIRLADGQCHASDIVISNVDPQFLYRHMIPKGQQGLIGSCKTLLTKPSMGLFVLYFGTKRRYDNLPHHTIIMPREYEAILGDIFNHKCLSDDLALYLHRPTATDKSIAPEGHDAFYCLCPVPNLSAGIDWHKEANPLVSRIINALEALGMPELSKEIDTLFFKTPEDFKTDYNACLGSGFSAAPVFFQSAWFRHHNQAEGIENLYLVGAGTHPGAGVPGVISSAKVVERLLPNALEHCE